MKSGIPTADDAAGQRGSGLTFRSKLLLGMCAMVLLLWWVPQIATWLPSKM